MKDYKKRIFIDKLIDLKGRTFVNSRLDLTNKFNLDKIPKDDYKKNLSYYMILMKNLTTKYWLFT